VGIEEILADVDTNKDSAHNKFSGSVDPLAMRTDGIPVPAGECRDCPQ
jgi:hypothetical protein